MTQCMAETKAGLQCKRKALDAPTRCWQHPIPSTLLFSSPPYALTYRPPCPDPQPQDARFAPFSISGELGGSPFIACRNSYTACMEEAEWRMWRGEGQAFCKTCQRYRWQYELCSHADATESRWMMEIARLWRAPRYWWGEASIWLESAFRPDRKGRYGYEMRYAWRKLCDDVYWWYWDN